jgi:diadenylate cyclase
VTLLRGVVVVGLIFLVVLSFFNLPALNWLFTNTLPSLLLAIPVIFQPELRRALEQLGRVDGYLRFFRRRKDSPVATAVTSACLRLSQRRHGALIVIEMGTGLQEYIDTGTLIDAIVTPELLLTIFNKHTELHDGAIIIRNERIAAAGAVMPLSTSSISDKQMGLRHRAGLGMSESSDAVVVIVSEERGHISIAHNGRILGKQDPAQLEMVLNAFMQNRGGAVSS